MFLGVLHTQTIVNFNGLEKENDLLKQNERGSVYKLRTDFLAVEFFRVIWGGLGRNLHDMQANKMLNDYSRLLFKICWRVANCRTF